MTAAFCIVNQSKTVVKR